MSKRKVVVICSNPHHRVRELDNDTVVKFALDKKTKTARAEVDPETAAQLLEADPEAYSCPELVEARASEAKRPALRKVEPPAPSSNSDESDSDEEDDGAEGDDATDDADEEDDGDVERGRAIARLTQVSGIGPITAKALYDAGVTSLERLAEVQSYEGALADVAEEADVSEEQLTGWSEQAQALLEERDGDA